MYTCERCGTRFGRVLASESCPRCLAREGVRVELGFRPPRLGTPTGGLGPGLAVALGSPSAPELLPPRP